MIDKFDIGIDITEIEKFKKKSYTLNKTFYKKIFNDNEIKYCLKYKNPSKHFAGKFALKEATIKAINRETSLKNIQTSHSNSKPTVKILKKNNYKFISSISHDGNYAIAIVISKKII